MKAWVVALTLLMLAGCASMDSFTRERAPGLFSALDTQPDGYMGMTSDGEHRFEIVSTRTDGMRLCRVVNIESENRFHTESFCKARGGEWR
jgi:hypothetical protein